jgi:NifU-like protein involved in Fe-S cluster formation
MTGDPYTALVRDYFANPVHSGNLAGAIVAEIDDQGIRLRLAATHANGEIAALRFRAWGCPHLIAACESFCVDYEGQPVASLSAFQAGDIMRNLSVPVEKTGRILVLEDAVRSLGRSICGGSVTQ